MVRRPRVDVDTLNNLAPPPPVDGFGDGPEQRRKRAPTVDKKKKRPGDPSDEDRLDRTARRADRRESGRSWRDYDFGDDEEANARRLAAEADDAQPKAPPPEGAEGEE